MYHIIPKSRDQILQGITELNRQGATIVYTSHYMEEVEQICTRISIIDKGRNVAEGTKVKLKRMLKNTETIAVEIPGVANERLNGLKALPGAYEVSHKDGREPVNIPSIIPLLTATGRRSSRISR